MVTPMLGGKPLQCKPGAVRIKAAKPVYARPTCNSAEDRPRPGGGANVIRAQEGASPVKAAQRTRADIAQAAQLRRAQGVRLLAEQRAALVELAAGQHTIGASRLHHTEVLCATLSVRNAWHLNRQQ